MNHLHNRDITTSGSTQGSPACAAPNGPVVVYTPHGNPLRHPIPHGRATVATGEAATIDHKSFNVNEEYINTLRTQSNAEFFAKTHLFISDPSIHTSSKPDLIIGALLEPEQDAISSILESLIFRSAISDLKLLLTSYFDTSTEASKFCTQLLRNINNEPVLNPNQADFKLIQDRYSSILHRLKTYILHRDFDTMSRLVARIHDEFEHNNMIIRDCMERKDDKCHVQGVVKEIKNSRCGIIRKVEELEEHVCLCLATINRARVLVMKEISPP
uniref:Uncharacterized protein n=1 Tax=Ananas comosus var. bracteatus TaxID=296719 RepID=A0A6V7P1D9_ANACO|nr:unnamed protein product [Ananas comosus var. bracteatus]